MGDPPRDGDHNDDHKIISFPNFNSVENLRFLGSVEAYDSYNGIVS